MTLDPTRPASGADDSPLVLGPEMLRRSTPGGSRTADPTSESDLARSSGAPPNAVDLRPARLTVNECILFDEPHATSWIIYPPRSSYSFVPRTSPRHTVVERRVWSPSVAAELHQMSLTDGCDLHGDSCPASVPIDVAVRLGYDPFS